MALDRQNNKIVSQCFKLATSPKELGQLKAKVAKVAEKAANVSKSAATETLQPKAVALDSDGNDVCTSQNVDIACPCNYAWNNHGDFMQCVVNAAKAEVAAGLITEDQKGLLVSENAKSDCGSKKGNEKAPKHLFL